LTLVEKPQFFVEW